MAKKQNQFVVIGGKWFDRVNGNTYHRSKIIDVKKNKIYYSSFQYGYGSQYLSTAREYITDVLKLKSFDIVDGGSFYDLKRIVKNYNF